MSDTDTPVRPKAVVSPDDIDQPRTVEWGHLQQTRGTVKDDRVRIVRQTRRHDFGRGTRDSGPERVLLHVSLGQAMQVYRALDALFDGGVMEGDGDGT